MEGEPAEETFELQLSGGGIALKRTVGAEVARAIVNIAMGGPSALPPPGSGRGSGAAPISGPASAQSGERLSLREYLDDCGASRNPDKITAIGNYLIDHDGLQDFGRDDVKARFRAAGEPPPANYPRDFMLTLRTGWIAEDAGASGRYYVTQKGRAAIAAKFSGEIKKASAKARGGKRAKRRDGSESGDPDE